MASAALICASSFQTLCRLGPDGTSALAAGLHSNSSLTLLDLAHNGVGDAGCNAFSAMLLHNSRLESLDVSNNNIGCSACHPLARAIERNGVLQELFLDANPLGVNGTASVVKALAVSTTLKRIGLQSVGFLTARTHSIADSFSRQSPNADYCIDLAHPEERVVALELVELWREHGPESWRGAKLDGKPFELTNALNWPAATPTRGVLELEFHTIISVADGMSVSLIQARLREAGEAGVAARRRGAEQVPILTLRLTCTGQ